MLAPTKEQEGHEHSLQSAAGASGSQRRARQVARKPAVKGSFSERLRLALGMINTPNLAACEGAASE
jgi:hypothetical protein